VLFRSRLDFAVTSGETRLDVECDAARWHLQKRQRLKDAARDEALRKLGWKILRIDESALLAGTDAVIQNIRRTCARKHGGE
jgi:very-short-patch-repair endonuclease